MDYYEESNTYDMEDEDVRECHECGYLIQDSDLCDSCEESVSVHYLDLLIHDGD